MAIKSISSKMTGYGIYAGHSVMINEVCDDL